ncbi:response regulator transcription factor [Solibacillus sp. FSL K6-1554]|uniref:response regulator transcription factor n=1 Tax=Solibacillus sp. FSL K6-1554 TaxID=2921472 RepID=UPI0030F8E8A8
MTNILVVEDELSIRSFVSLSLRKKGYDVVEAESGEQAIEFFQNRNFDVILLDLMLPGIDGFIVCQEIRKVNQKVGIIMITAKTQEKDKIDGLVIGADDYLCKPFSLKELEVRIFSLMRRINVADQAESQITDMLISEDFKMDLKNKKFYSFDEIVKLTPTEFSLLHFLMEHPNELFTRDELLDAVWGENYVGELKVVDVNIRRIRQKIEKDPSSPMYLCTEWGRGYLWKVNE